MFTKGIKGLDVSIRHITIPATTGETVAEKKKPAKSSGKQKKAAIKANRQAKQAKQAGRRPDTAE
ncbi:hypothetical protein Pta02_53560 [Planobispora takensis]|uniref:Uncharacterized protein n=1 Tax=Planobispora takensis TaxID=1367882 RepID=A0A8J3T309_9ACTN|nr:hypothetical protein Pta02_53560 [Planobispora takensis]